MKDDVDPVHRPRERLAVADVAVDNRQGQRLGGIRQVFTPAADEVVEHHHFARLFGDELVGDVRADQARSARDQDASIMHGDSLLSVRSSRAFRRAIG